MRKLNLVLFFLVFIVFFAFGEPENHDEIDYLLFLPNSGNQFADEAKAVIQLDNLAEYLLGGNLTPGQIYVYGYAAAAINDVDPVNLSRDRALFVINELQKRGVARNLFSEPAGLGSVDLWGGNSNEEDRSPNRRVRVVLGGSIVTPETIKDSGSEIVISSVDEKEPERHKAASEKTGAEFPWRFLLLPLFLTLIAALIYLLSKRKKSPAEKPAKPVKAEPVKTAPVKIKPVITEPAKAAPAAAAVIVSEKTVNLDEEIGLRAYELYLERGCQDGGAAGDWYRALIEVCAKYESAGCRTYFEGGRWRASLQEAKRA